MLVSVTELKKFLNEETITQDLVLYDAIIRAQAEAETYCDRKLELQEFTEYQKGNGRSEIQLRNYPVVYSGSYTFSIWDDPDLDFAEDVLLSADQYQLDQEWGVVTRTDTPFLSPLNPNLKSVKIVYSAGYTSANAPGDLKLAILKLSTADYKRADTYINAVDQSIESSQNPTTLREEAQEILDRYRRIR